MTMRVAGLLLVALACRTPSASAFRIAFVPSREVELVSQAAEPLIQLLQQETGWKVEATIAVSYVAVVEALGRGSVECAFMPPLAFVMAEQRYGAQVLLVSVRNGKTTYRGQILVPRGSVRSWEDLKGKRFAFPDPTSTSGTVFPKLLLQENGIDPDRDLADVIYAGGHDKVIFALLNGQVDAGATFEDARRVVARRFPEVMEKLEVFAYTAPIPNDNFACGKHVPPEQRQTIKQALLKVASTEEGRQQLFSLYEIDGFAEPTPGMYDAVRKALQFLEAS